MIAEIVASINRSSMKFDYASNINEKRELL